VLHARQATQALAASAQAHGARLELGEATPADGGARVELDGVAVAADVVVWACGAWLRGLFPELVDVRVTRQDYWYFGTPTGWETPGVPAFVDYDGAFYGHGDLDGRGFKLAPDAEGPELDPERGERGPNPRGARSARAYLARRFPALAEAPVLGTRVCQYAVTPDSEFVLAPHPQHPHVWLLGGDSGHGFKHAPALAEHVAALIGGAAEPDARFGLGPRRAERPLRTAGADATQ